MSAVQGDLFAHLAPPPDRYAEEKMARIRSELHAALALVKGTAAMAWEQHIDFIMRENAFRSCVVLLPREEGEALWVEFDREMDRLFAILNEGKVVDPPDDGRDRSPFKTHSAA